MTNAQKVEMERKVQLRNVRNRRAWALLTLIVFLSLSLAGNVRESWDLGIEGWIIAGSAPIILFISNMLFERISKHGHWFKRVVTFVGIGASILIAGYASYVHIHALVYRVTGDAVLAAIMPIALDVPMVLAGLILAECRADKIKLSMVPEVPAKPVRLSQASTAGAVSKPARTPRQRAPKVASPQEAAA